MLKNAVKIFLSHFLFVLGMAAKSELLLGAAVKLDPWNMRAKRWHFRNPNLPKKLQMQLLCETFDVFRALQRDCSIQPELRRCFPSLGKSEAQLFQDIFVLQQLDFKRDGYFVEIGVGDGQFLSNTFLLEKEFGWNGILAEPNRAFAARIRVNRGAVLDERAVYSKSGQMLEFLADPKSRELSTLRCFKDEDGRSRSGDVYAVETVSINDLLSQHCAPRTIDYLSIDTEGSEFEIIEHLDFKKFRPSIATIEHNGVEKKRRP